MRMNGDGAPRLRVGCAMWVHRAWHGSVVPAGARQGDELVHYSRWCDAVEGNTTFYATPSAATVERWAASTPADFRFVLKLPRHVTHERRLRGTDADVRAFLAVMEPLAQRIGAISVQLPPTFGPADLGALDAFLRTATRSVRWAVEVRHPRFSAADAAQQALHRVLERAGAERIVFDTTTMFSAPPTDDAEREAWTNKPRLPVEPVAFGAQPIVRYLGRSDDDATVAGWTRWVPVVAGWLAEGRSPIVFVHTPDNARAPQLARRFHAEVAALTPLAGRLPDVSGCEAGGPAQQSLFG
jgi:uncharacterized protein YecE (DUF72 family)